MFKTLLDVATTGLVENIRFLKHGIDISAQILLRVPWDQFKPVEGLKGVTASIEAAGLSVVLKLRISYQKGP